MIVKGDGDSVISFVSRGALTKEKKKELRMKRRRKWKAVRFRRGEGKTQQVYTYIHWDRKEGWKT